MSHVGAGGPGDREPVVDVVRGLALLGSVVATAVVWLHGVPLGAGYRPVGGSTADRVVDATTAVLVDNRVLPVFALLLGWGMVVRLRHVAWPALLRRAAVLLGVGALHAALLLEADILATLAVLMVLGLPLVAARARVQLLVVVLALPALLLNGVADGLGGGAGFPDPPADYLLSAVDRWGTWLLGLVLLPFVQLGLLLPLLAGARLARAGWLVQPWQHRRGLLWLGLVGTGAGVLGALPYAQVVLAGAATPVTTAVYAGVLSSLSGPVAAVGVVCLVVLAATAACHRQAPVPASAGGTGPTAPRGPGSGPAGVVVSAVTLLGRRSLPVYLLHSLVLALLLAPWAAGLGGRWGSAAVVALAVAVWLLSVAVAAAVSLAGVSRSSGRAVPAAPRRSPRERHRPRPRRRSDRASSRWAAPPRRRPARR